METALLLKDDLNCCDNISDTIVIYFGSMKINKDMVDSLKNKLNISTVTITEQCELIQYLNSTSLKIVCLGIDIEHCQTLSSTNLHDYIRMLSTILSLRGMCPPIVGITKVDTDAKWIKEFMTIPEIKGIVIRASESTREEMLEAYQEMKDGKYHIPRRIKQKIQDLKKQKKKQRSNSSEIHLTDRQQQIVDLVISKGASNKVIANILKISESTVKLHITNILKKYGLRNRTQLALFVKTKH